MGRLRRSLLLLVLVVLASGGLPWPFVGGQITNSAQQSLQEFPAWLTKGQTALELKTGQLQWHLYI